ncbi:Pyruvate kinase [Heracleum sosnowskyi]|uniref:Pyruvate kinase n=1 Tax=Heracleum sosnowskyi TaxID=360622 RepID=A0AAD8MB33_9APIA|nr:Pyruvate kinase [Heracleum sosnowskyi]
MEKRPKTKIVCTLGPSSRSVEMIEKLLVAGMNVARFNFSHGSHEYHKETLDNLRTAVVNTSIPCAVMLDTKGPEIRTGLLKDGKKIDLKQGQEITISTDYTIQGDEDMISMSYKKLAEDVKPDSVILCADGSISLRVLSCDTERGLVKCRCENSAALGEKKNVNLPGVIVDLPTLTEKDKDDILNWGVPNKIDIIALSFVRKGSDLQQVRKLLGEHGKTIVLMSKVENQEGVANFDDILANTDAFMVARGDLGMEIPIEKIFLAQKMMISKCNAAGKPVVTATQMLESMTKSPRPTRAEATDVANAVIDGTDCVMLSGETAAGDYPELAVQTMASICLEAENSLDYGDIFKVLVVVLTRGGTTAKLVSKYRPKMPILSVILPDATSNSMDWSSTHQAPARHGLIYRGIVPLLTPGWTITPPTSSTEDMLKYSVEYAKSRNLCKVGDAIVVMQYDGAFGMLQILFVK